jgi:hypothetical protein
MKTLELNDILFPVSIIDNPANCNSEHAKIVRATIDGEEKDLNYCSDRYELVPNEDIFLRMENELNSKDIAFTADYTANADLTRFYAEYTLEDKGEIMLGDNGDVIKPMVRINHSYNGLTKYCMSFGYFRLVCSNGLVIPYEGSEEHNLTIKGKHTKQILNSFDLIFGKLDEFIALQPQIQKRFEVLTDRKIENYGERLEAVLNATKIGYTRTNFTDMYDTITNEKSLYGGHANDFLVYNSINAHIFNEGAIAAPEKKYADDAKVLAEVLA